MINVIQIACSHHIHARKPVQDLCKVNLFWTFTSEPDGFPQNVEAESSSSNSILVTWDKVVPYDRNGIITSYNITYKSQTENDSGNVQVNGSVLQTDLINLKEHVNYSITVFASTVKGDGPPSNPIVVRTDQDSKYTVFSYQVLFLFVFVVSLLLLPFRLKIEV